MQGNIVNPPAPQTTYLQNQLILSAQHVVELMIWVVLQPDDLGTFSLWDPEEILLNSKYSWVKCETFSPVSACHFSHCSHVHHNVHFSIILKSIFC